MLHLYKYHVEETERHNLVGTTEAPRENSMSQLSSYQMN